MEVAESEATQIEEVGPHPPVVAETLQSTTAGDMTAITITVTIITITTTARRSIIHTISTVAHNISRRDPQPPLPPQTGIDTIEEKSILGGLLMTNPDGVVVRWMVAMLGDGGHHVTPHLPLHHFHTQY